MSDIEDSDDERPASFVSDHSIHASGGSSISSVKQFMRSNKELLLGIFMAIAIMEGGALFFEWRTKAVASDLASYNEQEKRVHLEVAEKLLTILNCRLPPEKQK